MGIGITKRFLAVAALTSLGLPSSIEVARPQSNRAVVRPAQPSVLRAARKPKVQIQLEAAGAAKALIGPNLNGSMKARRDAAWATMKRIWKPVNVEGGVIPIWMTWYERQDLEDLFREMRRRPAIGLSKAERSARVHAVLTARGTKDLQRSLSAERFGAVLRQFTFPEFLELGPHTQPGTGSIYFNPSYVQHLLENAESIANYNASAFSKTAGGTGTPGTSIEAKATDGAKAALAPNSDNLYALSMDSEMPSDAIMIKVTWSQVYNTPSNLPQGFDYIKQNYVDVSANMGPKLNEGPAGQWLKLPGFGAGNFPGGAMEGAAAGFHVTDDQGREWALMGMHIASKSLRTWQWITFFPAPSYSWRADKPDLGPWQFYHYQMATVSDFKEQDPKPWSAYEGTGSAHFDAQAAAIKAVAQAMNGVQWCANPYIETNMARTNCIGCHQGSPRDFLATALTKQRTRNVGDFSFSIATTRSEFLKVMQENVRSPR
jgi:hypothetical protein